MSCDSQAEQKANAAKGTGFGVMLKEGTSLFLGESAGKVVGSTLGIKESNVSRESAENSEDLDFDEMTGDEVQNPVGSSPA